MQGFERGIGGVFFCVIKGTPTVLGEYNFSIQVENAFTLGSYVHKKIYVEGSRCLLCSRHSATVIPEVVKKIKVAVKPVVTIVKEKPVLKPAPVAPIISEKKGVFAGKSRD